MTTSIVQQNQTINNALAGKYQALGWRQFGAVDPDLNYIFWSTTTVSSGSLSINMARNADPADREGAARRPPEHRAGRPGGRLQDGEQAAGPGPTLSVDWTGRSGRSSGTPDVQNFNNPTTPQGTPAFGMIGGSIWPTQIWIS